MVCILLYPRGQEDMTMTTTYQCTDGYARVAIEADTPREAAQAYVDQGDWGDDAAETCWITVYVTRCAAPDDPDEPERESYQIPLHPIEPDCSDGEHEHEWQAPYEILGGLPENPGVWGHGGGVIIDEICGRCGIYRRTDTWAQDPETGRQGLRSITYRPATDNV